MANAAPEWQAGSLRRRSNGLVVACPLEGLVGQLLILIGLTCIASITKRLQV